MNSLPNENRKGGANEVPIQTRLIDLGSDHDQIHLSPPFPPYQQIDRGPYLRDPRGRGTKIPTILPSKIERHYLHMAQQEVSKGEDGLDPCHHLIVRILQAEGASQPGLEMTTAIHAGGIVRLAPMNVAGRTMAKLDMIIDVRGAGVWIEVGLLGIGDP